MLVPGAEVPHLCAQCSNYPCVESCPVDAMSVHEETGAVIVDNEKARALPLFIPEVHELIEKEEGITF